MINENTKPGVHFQSFHIPATGTHNSIPPFTSKIQPGIAVEIHAIHIIGTTPGPTLYIGGGMHGDEINGIAAALRLPKHIAHTNLKGNLIIVPLQNPAGYEFKARLNPFDPIDPDWVHPGKKTGPYSQSMKYILNQLAARADCVMDLHTAGRDGTNNPMIYVPPEIGNGAGKRSLSLALAFGGDRIVYGTTEDEYGWPVKFAMPFVAVREGKPGLYIEAGSGGAGIPDERFVNYFITGVLNVLKTMEMLKGEITDQGERIIVDPSIEQDRMLRAPVGGIFSPKIQIGETVMPGQLLAEIHCIPEGEEQITAPVGGLITYLQRSGPTTKGDQLLVISSSEY
jgi:predicted deacylase